MPNIIIADSSFLVREGLKRVFEPKYTIVAESNSLSNLKTQLKTISADILVIDPYAPDFEGTDIIGIKKVYPKTQVLIISDIKSREQILSYTENGINHFLTKGCNDDEIQTCVHAMLKGDKFFCGSILDIILNEKQDTLAKEPLSDREREVLTLVAEGLPTKTIAEKLFLSVHTINAHRKNIIKKLGTGQTADLTKYAIYRGYIQPEKFC